MAHVYLWFNDQAEEAVNFYVSTFKNSNIISMNRFMDGGQGQEGRVMTATFQLEGQEFMALNGGLHFAFTEAISFFVHCKTKVEVDELWDKLTEGGVESQCGWLKDRYSVSWQIIPSALGEMLQDEDGEKSQRGMEAMLKMRKIDIKILREAYERP